MDRLFVDTNLVIDLLAQRTGFYEEAQELFSLADDGQVKLFVSSLTIANVNYILSENLKLKNSRQILSQFKVLVQILPMDEKIIELALVSDFKDFEDAIQYYTAIENDLEIIVTRNKKDFLPAKISVMSAKEYLAR